jgi:hypothetical protein
MKLDGIHIPTLIVAVGVALLLIFGYHMICQNLDM